MGEKVYLAIDLKSFYASVECIERHLDPLNTNLVVADPSRTTGTICLAVTPSLKAKGVSSRPRLYEVIQKVKLINKERLKNAKNHHFIGKSVFNNELEKNNNLELDYIIATPQMSHYIKVSSEIYSIYLKYFSPSDIHVYSIDEVFIDVSSYLLFYKCSADELANRIVKEIYKTTGITATVGIGDNLFLAKVAMDILAKHAKPNKDGVRIASLDEIKFRRLLWNHTPLTDFWRIGPGITRRLNKLGINNLGELAIKSLEDEDSLYEAFGINAELIIDHAWGYEPTTIKEIKEYKPVLSSLTTGQVLPSPYDYESTKLIVKEMSESLSLDLVKKDLVTDQIVLYICYDKNNDLKAYKGELAINYYGAVMPYPAHGTINLNTYTNSREIILKACLNLFEKIIDKTLLTRRVNIIAGHIFKKSNLKNDDFKQLNIFEDYQTQIKSEKEMQKKLLNEEKLQKTILDIKNKFGKNSMLKANNLLKGGTTIERNKQIGGHKA